MKESSTRSSDCCDCQWVAMGVMGIYCTMYHEEIISTDVAQECAEYKGI